MLKASGLHTFNSYLSSIPEGALFVAENVNIDRSGVVEPRRGIAQYCDLPTTAKQLLVYKDKLFAHYNDKLAVITGEDTYTVIKENSSSLDDVSIIESLTNLRLKFIEANGNLYITTNEGIVRFSSNRDITTYDVSPAGGVKALGLQAITDYTSDSGFLPKFSKVAYRVTWGKTDNNDNFIEGAPSPSIEVINVADRVCNARLLIDVPSQVDTSYFFRIYRTDVFSSEDFAGIADLVVSDESKLVFEQGHDGVTTQYDILDEAPIFFRDSQVPLYTNAFSGEGILQANEAPPFAQDITLYNNYTFYGNTRQKHTKLITLLGSERFISYGAVEDAIKINTVVYDGIDDETTITFNTNHELIVGQDVIIYHSTPIVSAVFEVKAITANTIVIDGDVGFDQTDAPTLHGSQITTQVGVAPIQTYTFVGRKEIFELEFEGYTAYPDYDNATAYVVGDKVTYLDNSYIATAPTTGNLPTDVTFWSPTTSAMQVQYPHGSYVQMFSAEDQVKYVVWFYTDDTQLFLPPSVPNAVFIGVDLTDEPTRTAEQVRTSFTDAVLNATFDFDLLEDGINPIVRVSTARSGLATDTTVSGGASVVSVKIQEGYGEDLAQQRPRLPKFVSAALSIFDAATSLSRTINSNPNETLNAYYLFDPQGLGGQIQLETKVLGETSFTISSNLQSVAESFNPVLSNVASNNERRANRVYFSKLSQPDAVPLVNFIDVGPRDEAILRIVALRDSMFIFKEKSIFRLAGDNPNNFTVVLHDNSAALITPDALTVLNNSIYALTTQGISQISDTGLTVVSRPIEDKISMVTAPRFRSVLHTIFAASYEQDRSFFLWVPKIETDQYATQCYRLNVFTNTWTSWDVNAKAAIVVPAENVLYKAAGDITSIEKERKNLTRTDYADRQFDSEIIADAFERQNQNIIKMGSVTNIVKGDTLVQTQYVTVSQVNRLMSKLEGDPVVEQLPDPSFYTRRINTGDDLTQFLTDLHDQLVADTLIDPSPLSFAGSFSVVQQRYNDLIDKINAGSLAFKTYSPSVGTVDFELIVENRNPATQEIAVLGITPVLQGPIIIYKAIRSEVVYAPLSFGDPAIMKHIRAGTMMFANADLAFGNLTYSTDLSPSYEGVDFTLEGDGSWGIFFYSSTSWGGEGTQRPFRTLIPRQKQRCRFIRPRFVHSTAFYKYLLYGVSFDLEVTNSRGYK